MKLSKELGKINCFYLLLLVGSFLLYAMFYSSPHASWLHNKRWTNMPQDKRHQNGKLFAPSNSDIHPDEWSPVNPTFEPQMQQSNTSQNSTSSTEKNVNTMESEPITSTLDAAGDKNEESISSKLICDFSDWRSDICNMTGDIRTQGYNMSTVFFVPPPNTIVDKEQEWSLNAYSQKMYMYFSKNVTVKQMRGPQNTPLCTVDQSNTPAILISFGGPTGNIWHDFTDVIIPLFLASRPLKRDVQILIINYKQWFLDKFSKIFKDLSRYQVINFDEDKEVRCFKKMSVGLLNHKDFSIDPKRAFIGFNMFNFRTYIRSIYSLPVDVNIPYKMDQRPEKKPRLLLVVRSKTRKFLNQEEISEVIKRTGFELVLMEPKRSDNLTDISKLVDSCDVLMGVHGAALTSIIFLRTNALMLQVIPLGGASMDYFATSCFGVPADDMRLRRIDYHITPEESSLFEMYGRDDPIVKDPDYINSKGWTYRQKYYWNEQNVRLNLTRLEPVLVKSLELLKA